MSMTDETAFEVGAQSRRHAGRGRLRKRAHAADPVSRRDGYRLRAPAGDRAAVHQQVLHPRSAARELVRALRGGRRVTRCSWCRGATCPSPWARDLGRLPRTRRHARARRRARDLRRRQGERARLLRRRNAARPARSRCAARRATSRVAASRCSRRCSISATPASSRSSSTSRTSRSASSTSRTAACCRAASSRSPSRACARTISSGSTWSTTI